MPDRARRPMRILALLTLVGDLLVLQLSWLVASLAVVTAVPAAFALQRCLADRLHEERDDEARERPSTPHARPGDLRRGSAHAGRVAADTHARSGMGASSAAGGGAGVDGTDRAGAATLGGAGFFRRFGVALRALWPLGIAGPVALAVFTFSALFWASAEGAPRILALAVLLPLGGLALSLYLGMLGAAPGLDERAGVRELARAGWGIVLARPLRAAGCIVLLVTWLLVLTRLPTLLLITSGVVPALAAHWLASPDRGPVAATR